MGLGAKVLSVLLGAMLLFSSFQTGLDNFLHNTQPDEDLTNVDSTVQNAYAQSALPGTNLVTQIEMLDYYFPIISTSFIKVPGTEFNFDQSLYNGQVKVFFEVVFQSIQLGGTVNARLFDKTGNIVVPDSMLSTGSTSPTRLRSPALSLSASAHDYVIEVSTSSSSNPGILLSGRMIVQQNAATNTSVVIPIGNVALSLTGQPDGSKPMLTSSTNPTFIRQIAKIYHFNQTKFDGNLNVFFESVISTNKLQRSAFASLFDLTTNSTVTGSEVSTSNLIPTRVRSGNLTLVSGHDYTFAIRSSSTDAIATSFGARIIIAQKNFTSTEIPIRVANIFATKSSNFINVPTSISSINASSYTSPRFSFEANLFTKNTTLPAFANLFDLTKNLPVSSSEVSSIATISTRLKTGIINLTGTSEYIAQLRGSGDIVILNNAWVLVSLNLINKYVDIISELDRIGRISDESVVTDYLNHTLTNLRNDTNSLVSDIQARQSLISILDSALLSANSAGSQVLALNETGANTRINETRSSVGDYINTVKALNGTKISTSTANILFGKASQISTDSLKRGINATQITVGIPLFLTGKIIDRAKTDVASLRETVSIIESRGFTVTIKTQRLSPTQGIVSFFNNATSQIFDVVIPNLALSVSTTIGISEEALLGGLELTKEQVGLLMNFNPLLLERVTTLQNATIAGVFVSAAVCVGLKSIPNCIKLVGFTVSFVIATHPEIQSEISRAVTEQLLPEVDAVFNFLIPKVTISGLKFNDINGNRVREMAEEPLSGFGFSLSARGAIFDRTIDLKVSGDDGIFSFTNQHLPIGTKEIVLAEQLTSTQIAQGWTNTTDTIRTISFQPDLVRTDFVFGNRIPPPPETVFLSDSFESCFDTGWVVVIPQVTCTTDNPKDGKFAMKLEGNGRLFKPVSITSNIQKVSVWFYPSFFNLNFPGTPFFISPTFGDCSISCARLQLFFGVFTIPHAGSQAAFVNFTPQTTEIPMVSAGQYHNAVIEYDKINRSIKVFVDGQLVTTRFVTQSLDLTNIQFDVRDNIVWVDSVEITGRASSFAGDAADYAFCDAASGIGWTKVSGVPRISCSDQNVKDGVYSVVFINDGFGSNSILRKSLTGGSSTTFNVWFNPSGSGFVQIIMRADRSANIVSSSQVGQSLCEAGTSAVPISPVTQGVYHNVVLNFARINATHASFNASVDGLSCSSIAPSTRNIFEIDLNSGVGFGVSQVTYFDSPKIGS